MTTTNYCSTSPQAVDTANWETEPTEKMVISQNTLSSWVKLHQIKSIRLSASSAKRYQAYVALRCVRTIGNTLHSYLTTEDPRASNWTMRSCASRWVVHPTVANFLTAFNGVEEADIFYVSCIENGPRRIDQPVNDQLRSYVELETSKAKRYWQCHLQLF